MPTTVTLGFERRVIMSLIERLVTNVTGLPTDQEVGGGALTLVDFDGETLVDFDGETLTDFS